MGCLISGIAMLFLSPILIVTGLLKVIFGSILWFLLLPVRFLGWFF
ncbi:MAG: hypothetical protein ACM3ZQ_09645 [Bacillota bacterium]